MAVTYGFYDSTGGDRKYNAEQMGSIFDGIIQDGVYANIGNAFQVRSSSPLSMIIQVDTGRAWLNHTWTLNDAILTLTVSAAHSSLKRIDTVVLEVNGTTRVNGFLIVQGTPSSNPQPPTLTQNPAGKIWQYPLANILVNAGVTTISQANITNRVGTTALPFVTGVLSTFDATQLYSNWATQYDQWIGSKTTEFQTWFNSLNAQLQGDVAANMAAKIAALETKTNTMSIYSVVDGFVTGANRRPYVRGNYLGSSLSSNQKTVINNGSFSGLFLGDYWTINGIDWKIVDFDYWWPALNVHHLAIMPRTSLYSGKMNSSNNTTGAYVGSSMFISGLNTALTTIVTAFGNVDKIPNRTGGFNNATYPDTGLIKTAIQKTVRIELPSEEMIFGTKVISNQGYLPPGSQHLPSRYGWKQLAYYQVISTYNSNDSTKYWTRDVANQFAFVGVDEDGDATPIDAGDTYGVRPIFALVG